jgi:hypothetical protein
MEKAVEKEITPGVGTIVISRKYLTPGELDLRFILISYS